MAGESVTVWDNATIKRKFLRSYKIAAPDADTSGGQPVVDAQPCADITLAIMRNAAIIGDTLSLDNRTTEDLNRIGAAEGVARPPASGASGYVVVSTSIGGATIFAGDVLKPQNSNVRYQCAVTALYADGDSVLVIGIDTGTGTNLPAGTILEWENPRPGCSQTCEVWSEGLTAGRNQADNDEYKALMIRRRGEPSTAGNAAAYAALVENAFATGIAVQKAFVWPAIKGTGTTGISFTMRPESPGGSRLPSSAQLAIMLAALEAGFPHDDGQFMITLSEQPATLQLRVTWKKAAAGWASVQVWPPYVPTTPVYVDGAASIEASAFRVTTDTGGSIAAPQVGQTIALFNSAGSVDNKTRPAFEIKTIDTVTEIAAGTSWDLTFDMDNGASSSFVPVAGALVSPWSDSLNLVLPPVVAYFDAMGPGEMLDPLPDPGKRGRRQPESPEAWPSSISNRIDALVQGVSAVRSANLVSPASTEETDVGAVGVFAYLRRLSDVGIYAE